MLPELDYRARAVVREAAQGYLSPSFDTADPPNVIDLAEARGLTLDYTDFLKVGRYAIAAANIHLLMDEAVEGTGPDAQFVDRYATNEWELKPVEALKVNIVNNFLAAADRLSKPKTSLYDYLLRRYVSLSRQDPDHTLFAGQPQFINQGGTLGFNGAQFVALSSEVLAADPSTRDLEKPDKIAIAHELTPVVAGAASNHLSYTGAAKKWYQYSTENTELVQRGGTHALRQSGGGALLRTPPAIAATIKRRGPLIKCPAHQLLFSDATALQRGTHAVINLGGDRGFYA